MSDYRVLVTGSRSTSPDDDAFIRAVLDRVTGPARGNNRHVVLIEGECPYGGVDDTARQWGLAAEGVTVDPYPAGVDAGGRILGPARNQRMVDAGADICVAFPAPGSRGTWDCLRKAADAGIPGRVYPIMGGQR